MYLLILFMNTLQYEVLTREFVIDEVAKCLDLNPNRFCLLGALLGNHILPPAELKDFHEKLAPELKQPKYKVSNSNCDMPHFCTLLYYGSFVRRSASNV